MVLIEKFVDFIISILKVFQFITVVNAYQKGLVLRFGKFKREVGPGLVWLVPFYIDTMLCENIVMETLPVGPQSLTTLDGKSIILGTIASFTIEDVKKFLLEVEGRNQFLQDSLYGIQSKFIMTKTWAELCEVDIENELTKSAKRRAKDWGVSIIRVQVSDFTISPAFRLFQSNNALK